MAKPIVGLTEAARAIGYINMTINVGNLEKGR